MEESNHGGTEHTSGGTGADSFGGRVQTREKQGENGGRWREDKVGAITSYLPGDGTSDHPPKPLVTTYVATMERTEAFGRVLRVEAERRGMRRAGTVLVMGDGGNWIDPLSKRECLCFKGHLNCHAPHRPRLST